MKMKIKFITLLVLIFSAFAQDAYLAFEIKKITPEQAYQLSIDSGVLITKIKKDSSLQKSGINVYDIILKFEDKEVKSASDIQRHLNKSQVGQVVSLEIFRKGKRLIKKVTLEKLPDSELVSTEEIPSEKRGFNSSSSDLFKAMEDSLNELRKKSKFPTPNRNLNFHSFNNQSNFSGTQVIVDNDHYIKLTNDNGKKSILIKEQNKGSIIFKGQVNTDDDIKKIPESVRNKVKNLLKSF